MHDPARVSHLPVRQSVRHPSGVAGIEPHRNPESSGLRPSTSGLKKRAPLRGASYLLRYLIGQVRQVGRGVRHPKGARSIGIGHPQSGDRCVENRFHPLNPLRVAEQSPPYDPARASHLRVRASVRRPGGVVGWLATSDPRVFGAMPLDRWLESGHPCRGASAACCAILSDKSDKSDGA